jgi:hypothetical protein
MIRLALTALTLSLVLPLSARADWTGKLRITLPARRAANPPREGRLSAKGGKLRVELAQPGMGQVVAILDSRAKRSTVLMVDRKAFTVSDLEQESLGAQLGSRPGVYCEGSDVAGCLGASGFKKAGSESVNGWKATRWSRERSVQSQRVYEDVWTPDGFGEVALVRQVTTAPGRTTTIDVLELQKAEQPAAEFELPSDYSDLRERRQRMSPVMPPRVPPRRPPGTEQPDDAKGSALAR